MKRCMFAAAALLALGLLTDPAAAGGWGFSYHAGHVPHGHYHHHYHVPPPCYADHYYYHPPVRAYYAPPPPPVYYAPPPAYYPPPRAGLWFGF